MIYLDTGCLLKLYYPELESPRVARIVSGQTIAFVAIHELELSNALELKLFRKQGSRAQIRGTLALVAEDVAAGVLYRPAVAWDDIWQDAGKFARDHSRNLGCRSLDILHCAAAKHVAPTLFVTTDVRQRKLAEKIGLRCATV